MRLLFLSSIILLFVCSVCNAQNCNNWLYTPSQPAFAQFGQINVTGNKISVEATFNRTSPYTGGPAYAGDLVSKHNTPADVNYLLRPNNAEITTSNGYFRTPDICEIELNKTYHVALVYDGATLKFYRNGLLMSQVAASGNLFQNTWKTQVGFYEPQAFNTNFIGYINEVRIWNVARTQDDIRAYISIPLPNPTTQSGLLAYYSFDNLVNKQGNSLYNGTLSGTAAFGRTNPNCNIVSSNLDFNYKQDICNPLSVQFFAIGTSSPTNFWSFGDGISNNTNATPSHLYSGAGTYTVKYTNESGSCSDTVIKNVSVVVLPANDILTPDTTVCLGTSKQLRTRPALNFCWSPTTYLDNPASPNPTTTTKVPITYYFTTESEGANVIANGDFSQGNSGFTSQYNYATPNITEAQYFVGTSPQSWNPSVSNCPDHTTGTGNMMLVNGAPVPDVNVWTQTVVVTPNTNYAFSTWIQALYAPNPAQLSFSINGSNLGGLIKASLPTCTWQQFYTTWNSGSNTTARISIVNKNTFVEGNDFALDDISFSPVVITRDSVKIKIETATVSSISDTATCEGSRLHLTTAGASTYSWTPAAGLNDANTASPIAVVTTATQFIVKGISTNGCTATDTINISVKPAPVLSLSADTIICRNGKVQLFASGGNGYAWSPISTLSNPSIANPIASPSTNTVYRVTITGTNGCTNSDSTQVSLKPLPQFTVSPDQATCNRTSVLLSAGGGTSYLWSPADLVSNAASSNPTALATVTTTYTVHIKENTCNDSAILTTTLRVAPPPTISVTKSNDLDCVVSSSQLLASGATFYVWSPATGLNNTKISNPIAAITTPQVYMVTGTDTSTNCSATASISLLVKAPFEPAPFIPTAFSPNGDGLNDCFKVKHFGTVKSVSILIFNRLGNRVFQSQNVNDCWDGTYKGLPADIGNYVYVIKTFNDCGETSKKGNLLLVR